MSLSGWQVLALEAGVLLAIPALGQQLASREQAAAIQKAFEAEASAARLHCQISPVRPSLTFAFRFQTGYRIDAALNQFHGPGHSLTVHTRVTPEGRDPVYLTLSGNLPAVPPTHDEAETSGAFVVGEGAYRVEVLMQDDQQRVCRGAWKIQAQLAGSERELTAGTPAGAVEALSAAGPQAPAERGGLRIGRLTILLDAAPMSARFSRLQPDEVAKMADSVGSVLEDLPANSVRLIVFNLDQRAVLFRRDEFTLGQIGELAAELTRVQLATVDYRVLQRPDKPIDVLAGLMEAEIRSPQPPDALIVMGPRTRVQDGVPSSGVDAGTAPQPIFYLQYQGAMPRLPRAPMPGPMMRPQMGSPPDGDAGPMPPMAYRSTVDAISRLMGSLKGETIPVRTPHDLAGAIRRMDGRIVKNSPPVETAKIIVPPAAEGQPKASLPDRKPAQPTGGEDPTEVLVRLRDQIFQHAARIPNYTCVEAIQRDRYEPVDGRAPLACGTLLERRKAPDFSNRLRLDATDWLRLDVATTPAREIYSWAGAKQFEEGDIDELVREGAFGTGPFASILLSIFEAQDRKYAFEGEKQEGGRRVFEYAFAVPQEASNYRVKAGKDWVITGYRGTLLVDPKTAELVRLAVESEKLPPETAACEVDNFLDYGLVQLGEGDYLLPKLTHQRFIGRDSTEGDNTVTFSACREYQAESTVSFGEGGRAGEGKVSLPAAGLDLPAGLPVTVELLTVLQPGATAAGDRIQGRLARPILNARQQTLVPAGTAVEGRVMRLETRYAPHMETTFVFRWESLRMGGRALPLNLLPHRPADLKAAGSGLRRRGMEIELPLSGEAHYAVVHQVGERALESGYQSEWLTAR